jgi:anti-sigma factor RsiW
VNACRDLELLVSLGAAGALAPDEAARLDTHLAGCSACRAELEASAKALGLARMPAPSRAEEHLPAELPGRMIDQLRRGDRRRAFSRRFALAAAIAAVFAVALLLPARFRQPSQAPHESSRAGSTELATAAPVANRWQEPDLDTVWQETDLVDFAADSETGDGTDTAYTAGSWATQ